MIGVLLVIFSRYFKKRAYLAFIRSGCKPLTEQITDSKRRLRLAERDRKNGAKAIRKIRQEQERFHNLDDARSASLIGGIVLAAVGFIIAAGVLLDFSDVPQ